MEAMIAAPHPAMSPPRHTKTSCGRIEKSRVKKSDTKSANYSIAGRTYACDSCKRGHRVSKCTHALQRPVHMTNDPGRPSADQKRHCDCPKQCSCTKKNCKCDRTCLCTQLMYMLVYVPFTKGEEEEENEVGEWRIDREVITDLKGNQLSLGEIRSREQKKQRQPGDVRSKVAQRRSIPFDEPFSQTKTNPTSASTLGSCCSHKKAIETNVLPKPPIIEPHLSGAARRLCDCGSTCACAFCLDHPNNSISQDIARQKAKAYFAKEPSETSVKIEDFPNHSIPAKGSCMGTNPQFAMLKHSNPTSMELSNAFGTDSTSRNGYFLSYPLTMYQTFPNFKPSLPLEATGPLSTQVIDQNLLTTLPVQDLIPDIPDLPNLPEYNSDSLFLDPTMWNIGDASTSSFLDNSINTYSNLEWLNPQQSAELWPGESLNDGATITPAELIMHDYDAAVP